MFAVSLLLSYLLEVDATRVVKNGSEVANGNEHMQSDSHDHVIYYFTFYNVSSFFLCYMHVLIVVYLVCRL